MSIYIDNGFAPLPYQSCITNDPNFCQGSQVRLALVFVWSSLNTPIGVLIYIYIWSGLHASPVSFTYLDPAPPFYSSIFGSNMLCWDECLWWFSFCCGLDVGFGLKSLSTCDSHFISLCKHLCSHPNTGICLLWDEGWLIRTKYNVCLSWTSRCMSPICLRKYVKDPLFLSLGQSAYSEFSMSNIFIYTNVCHLCFHFKHVCACGPPCLASFLIWTYVCSSVSVYNLP